MTSLHRSLTVLLALTCLALLVCLDFTPDATNDKWIQMKVGQEILETGHIPKTLEYGFTESKDAPFVAHEWLPSILFAKWYQLFGDNSFAPFKIVTAAIIALLTFLLVFGITHNVSLSFFFIALDGLVMHYRLAMRPESLAWCYLLVELILVFQYAKSRKVAWLYYLCPLIVLWANSHGSFPLAVAIPAILIVGQVLDDLRTTARNKGAFRKVIKSHGTATIAIGALGLSCLINPYGVALIHHVVEINQSDWLRRGIIEWLPPFSKEFIISYREAFCLYLAYSFFLLACLCIGRKKLTTSDAILSGIFFLLSLTAQRQIVIFCLVSTLVAAKSLSGRWQSTRSQVIVSSVALVLIGGMTLYSYYYGNALGDRPGNRKQNYLSEEAHKFIRENKLRGNVLNSYPIASELIFHYYPDIRITIDSRVSGYGEEVWKKYLALSRFESELKRFIDTYHVDHFILLHRDFRFFVARTPQPWLDWKVIYSDPTIVIASRPEWCPHGQECPSIAQMLNRFKMDYLEQE